MTTLVMERLEVDRGRQVLNGAIGLIIGYLCILFYTKWCPYFVKEFSAVWDVRNHALDIIHKVDTPSVFKAVLFMYAALCVYRVGLGFGRCRNIELFNAAFKWFTGKRQTVTDAELQSVLLFAVKVFFLPIMLNAFVKQMDIMNFTVFGLYDYWTAIPVMRHGVIPNIDSYMVQSFLVIIYFIDLIPFILGYMLESDEYENRVRSVDTSGFAWLVCLICYNPFSFVLTAYIPLNIPEYVEPLAYKYGESWKYAHTVINYAAVACLAIYACASVSLGLKSSNMTSRGVVQGGVYALCRHPAYGFKTLAWWIFAIGLSMHLYADGKPFVFLLFCLAVKTVIYYVRALTEEAHLSRTDPDYAIYMQHVRYRFWPGVL